MREILFRGKRIDNGEWVEGKGVDLNFDTPYILTKEYDCCAGYYMVEFEVIPDTVGQYTGLEDRNGKKIFEGDIIRHFETGRTEEIFFWEGAFCTAATSIYGEKYGYYLFDSEYCEDLREFEVIGNTHDNPELQEGNK